MSREGLAVVQEWINAGKDLLFPPSCRGCMKLLSAPGKAMCEECLRDVAFIESPKCTGCGRGLSNSSSGDHLCGACLRRKVKLPFSTAVAITYYQEPVSTLLHSLKYGGDLSVLPALQAIIARKTIVALQEGDRVIPVPLHIKRLRYRGFNQAVLIARVFFPENLNCILVDALQRVRHTDPQTDLDGVARRKNLRHAFAVSNREAIRNRKIVLVDDVYTTGSTVSECSRVLLAAGAREVQVLTLARVRE